MYLHLGGSALLRHRDLIAILDMDNTSVSKITREFLRGSEEEGFVKSVSEELPKTYIICEEQGKSRVYISPISSATLLKRAE